MPAAAALYKLAQLPEQTAATLKGVTAAYHQLAREWHPDRNCAPEATARFQEADKLYKQAIAQLSAPPEIYVRRVAVPAATVMCGGTVAATYTRASTTASGDVAYAWHTETVPVAQNAALPAMATVDAAGDELPGHQVRGGAVFELIDASACVEPNFGAINAQRVPGTHDLVAWVTIETESALVNGSTLAVLSPFWETAAPLDTGEWPTMRPQPLEFPGLGLHTPGGERGTLFLHASGGAPAALRPAVAKKLAHHYRAACTSPS